jgi:ABC-type polysaccharide/polyol phosphate transport system ATPase subunit
MAMRLCFDLGLHINTDIYVQQEIISAAESRARQTAFWGCYVMN